MLFLGNDWAEAHHDVELAGGDQRLDPQAPLGLDPHQHLTRPHRPVGPGDPAGRPSPCLAAQCGGWALAAVRKGGRRVTAAPNTLPPPTASERPVLDLPGRPVPVQTGGHTLGHIAVYLPHQGAVVTGDALVTGHPVSNRYGPELLPGMFNADGGATRKALATLGSLDADLILPGHGAPVSCALSEAIDHALNS